jgi:PKHD-type hydroxylase
VVETAFGTQSVNCPPVTSCCIRHRSPSCRADYARTALASFFWVQSMVRDDGARRTLFELDSAIQALAQDSARKPAIIQLTGVYHNLLRRWADV